MDQPSSRNPGNKEGSELNAESTSTDDRDTSVETPRTTLGLLRWGWERLTVAPELTVPFVLIAIAVTVAQAGITTVQTDLGTVPRFAFWVWPVYLLSFLGGWVGLGAVFLSAADTLSGIERRHTRRLIIAAKRVPSMLVAGIIGGIPIIGGLLALLIPGVYLMLKLAFTFPACVIDDMGAVAGLRRSFVLTGDHISEILGLLLAYAAIMVFVSTVVTVLVGRANEHPGFIGPLLQNLIAAVTIPLFGLTFGRLYLG